MSRDHKRAYQRRNQLAQQRGFASYSQQRRFQGNPTTEGQFKALPEVARQRRAEVLDAINDARRLGISVVEAAARARVPLPAVVWWGAPALYRPASRNPRTRKADRLLRANLLVADGELRFITTRGSNAARKVNEAYRVQRAFIDGEPGSAKALAGFAGTRVGGHLVETDPAVLNEIGRRGELGDIADMYRAWLS